MKSFQFLLVLSLGAVIASGDAMGGKRLIKTLESPEKWMNQEEIFDLIRNKTAFMDVTNFDYSTVDFSKAKAALSAIPTEPRFQETVRNLIDGINITRVIDFVTFFSSYHNRYCNSSTGRESQLWLLEQIQNSVEGYVGSVEVAEVEHGYLQKSIIVRLNGTDQNLRNEVVIIGAHLDSINKNGPTLNAPGADDNGSGTSTILEVLRLIISSGLQFKRTLEFHWYAAEEIGLMGSQDISQDYRRRNVSVISMLNLDVVSYHNGTNAIGIHTDDRYPALIDFVHSLTDEYLDYGWREKGCPTSCSDHASWSNNGFPAVFTNELLAHPQMHTVNDTIQNMNFTQVREFAKLTIGFAVELAEPNSSTL